jgi:hypothetical protein
MRIAYVNTDEVNHSVAAQMAGRYGAVIDRLHPEEPLLDVPYDGVLYNLDAVPRHRRRDVLAQIVRSRPTCPKAVHGYSLAEDQAFSLRQHGVAVAQRLQSELLRILCRAVIRKQGSVPPDDAIVEETWINLA